MSAVSDQYFDLAIVDPPYGIGTKAIKPGYKGGLTERRADHRYYRNGPKDRPPPEYFQELARISQNQIIWGANHLCDLFNAKGNGWVIWNKKATGNFSDCELAYTSFNRSLQMFTYQWNGMLQGDHGDKRKNESRIHPSQKPVVLYKWLLETFATPGMRIFDSHLGSGSSAIAANWYLCDFVGTEIDEQYFHAARARINDETKQPDMWMEAQYEAPTS